MSQMQPERDLRRAQPSIPPQFGQYGMQPQQYRQPQQVQPYGQWQQRPYWQQGQPPVKPKSPSTGLLIGLLLPGMGCVYADRDGVGVVILLLWLVSIPLAFVGIGIFTGFVLWVTSVVLGYTMTKEWNRVRGVAS